MHNNSIYTTLKAVLADLTGKDESQIFSRNSLRGDLRFNEAGLFALAVDLNRAFRKRGTEIKPPLHGDETRAAETVRALRLLISDRFKK